MATVRLPSEPVPTNVDPRREIGPESVLLPFQSALSLRALLNGEQRAFLKLEKHNYVAGSVLTQPYFCDSNALGGRGILPILGYWRQRFRWLRPTYPPSLVKNNINRTICEALLLLWPIVLNPIQLNRTGERTQRD